MRKSSRQHIGSLHFVNFIRIIMTKEIILTRGFVSFVDDWNYEWLNSFKWYECQGYAMRRIRVAGVKTSISMHRFILGLEHGDSRQGDHINHNGLDNREANLRVCSRTENMRNRRANIVGSSRFKGVSYIWCKSSGKWRASIKFGENPTILGDFSSEEEAAVAYDNAALQYFGDFACTNKALGLL